jgi:hypothetical protein
LPQLNGLILQDLSDALRTCFYIQKCYKEQS